MTDQVQTVGHAEPAASRPLIPGYGVPESDEGVLPWRHATERLARSRHYWVGSAGPDGRPHAVPVWGVWIDGALYFTAGPRSSRNLAANPQVTVHLESGDDVVILEGTVEPFADPAPAVFARVADAFAAKYDYRPESAGGYVLRPSVAYAWTTFPADATRWHIGAV